MNINTKLSKKLNSKNKLMRKIKFFQDNINYDDVMSYSDNSYQDDYDEIILNDDIFVYDDDKFTEDFYKDDTLFY